jgi:hypothetical protein
MICRRISTGSSARIGALLVALLLGACGSGSSDIAPLASLGSGCEPNEKCSPPSRPDVPALGASPLLVGDGGASAIAALPSVAGAPASASGVHRGQLLSRIDVYLRSTATIEQFNAVSRASGATAILTSRPGLPAVTLQIPRQASIAAQNALVAQLRTLPGVLFATAGRTFSPSVMPGEAQGAPVPNGDLGHLLMSRFPQAWNALGAADGCLGRAVPVYVWDLWGQRALRPQFLQQIEDIALFDDPQLATLDASDESSGHGYDVALTLWARADVTPPTGALPASFVPCVGMHQVEAANQSMVGAIARLADRLELQQGSAGPFVLNVSFGYPEPLCGSLADQPCSTESLTATPAQSVKDHLWERVLAAAHWARIVNALGVQDRMLIALAAGNVDDGPPGPDGAQPGAFERNYLGFRDARFVSPVKLAAHLSGLGALLASPALWKSATVPSAPAATFTEAEAQSLIDAVTDILGGSQSPDGSNIVVVDSASCGPSATATTLSCGEEPEQAGRSLFNFVGGQLRAVGEHVQFDGDQSAGTSFAAPQVAGLAAYLWILSDELRNLPIAKTIELLKTTGRPVGGDGIPLIRAYAATLALDQLNPSMKRVRRALLDVNGDGVFDHLDLQRFETGLKLNDPNAPTIPETKDHSRFDLNGDGATGGITTAAFDLDVDGEPLAAPKIGIVHYDLPVSGGDPIRVQLNEAAVNDLEILCYYAYSPLYTGDTALRADILRAQRCLRVRMETTLNGTPGSGPISGPAPVVVTMQQPDGQGGFAALQGVPVELAATCGSVVPASGQTDANGQVSATLTPGEGCASVTLNVVAKAPDGQQLAQQSLSGTLLPSSTSAFVSGSLTAVFDPDTNVIDNECFLQEQVPATSEVPTLSVACAPSAIGLTVSPQGISGSATVSQSGAQVGVVSGLLRVRIGVPQTPGRTYVVRAEINPGWFTGTALVQRATISNIGCEIAESTAFYEVRNGVTQSANLVYQGRIDPGAALNGCLVDVGVNIARCSSGTCSGSGELIRFTVTAQ